MIVKIGNRKFSEITKELLHEFLVSNGLFNMKIFHWGEIRQLWNTPKINSFSNKKDIINFEFEIKRIKDGFIQYYSGSLDLNKFYIYYNKEVSLDGKVRHFQIKDYNFLIKKGFNLPLESFEN